MKRENLKTMFQQRNKFRLSHFINNIFYVRHMAELHKFIEYQINEGLGGAYIAPYVDEKGRCRINISMGEDKAFNGWVSWKDFAELFWEAGDIDRMKKFIPLLESLARKLKRKLKAREAAETD